VHLEALEIDRDVTRQLEPRRRGGSSLRRRNWASTRATSSRGEKGFFM